MVENMSFFSQFTFSEAKYDNILVIMDESTSLIKFDRIVL